MRKGQGWANPVRKENGTVPTNEPPTSGMTGGPFGAREIWARGISLYGSGLAAALIQCRHDRRAKIKDDRSEVAALRGLDRKCEEVAGKEPRWRRTGKSLHQLLIRAFWIMTVCGRKEVIATVGSANGSLWRAYVHCNRRTAGIVC
jgi:hypothetical protein